MELRHLRYFIAVAEEKSISRAAERLHLSQPPLTRQIQLLEQKVGTRLFDRSSTGVALTAAGRFFLEDARLILAMVTQAEERAQSAGLGQIGRIDIAVFGSVMFDDLPQLLARFRDTHPRVEVVLHTLNKGDQIEALRQHRITIGFNRLTSNFTDIATTRLKAERLVIALHHSHPLAAQTTQPCRSRGLSIGAVFERPAAKLHGPHLRAVSTTRPKACGESDGRGFSDGRRAGRCWIRRMPRP